MSSSASFSFLHCPPTSVGRADASSRCSEDRVSGRKVPDDDVQAKTTRPIADAARGPIGDGPTGFLPRIQARKDAWDVGVGPNHGGKYP